MLVILLHSGVLHSTRLGTAVPVNLAARDALNKTHVALIIETVCEIVAVCSTRLA